MVLGGSGAEHDQLPVPAYVAAAVPLARKRALDGPPAAQQCPDSDQHTAECVLHPAVVHPGLHGGHGL
jgi:hypothetical protein